MSAKQQDSLVPVSISVPTAARLLGVSPRTCWMLVKENKIKSFRVGSRVLIPYYAITSFVEQQLAAQKGA